jgi:3-mercaptopyruvate sulfurtransferase SseA
VPRRRALAALRGAAYRATTFKAWEMIMWSAWKLWWVTFLFAVCMALGIVKASAADAPLVSAAWLKQNLSKPDIHVIDASFPQLHAAGHIPGAVNVDLFSFGGREVAPGVMEKRFQNWGVTDDKTVVLYDQGGTYMATSLFFDLVQHGFPVEKLKILDGGLSKWRAEGGTVTKDATPKPAPGNFRVTARNEELQSRIDHVFTALGNPARHAVIEAMEETYYTGAQQFFDRAGHLPNAVNLPTVDLFNADKTFKSPAEIRKMFEYLGVTAEKEVHTQCGGGIAASGPFFAAKYLIGYPKVKLYKGSMLDWLRDERNLPMWSYAAPNLLRDKHWLDGWSSPMLRMTGGIAFNIIDVRSAEAFKQANIPFSVNIPAETFAMHLNDPAALAKLLGAAGVNPNMETAIVSDGRVNGAAALALLALESLGQKKVSILTDSIDDWAFAGLALNRATDKPDPKRPPMPPPRPVNYVASAKAPVLVSNEKSTAGAFPKVFIASGSAMPTRKVDGTLIHVPREALFAADGHPKPAKEILAALTKAKVPRYAEIVLVADDLQDAALNYLAFRLMGYPDVKVLSTKA